MQNDNYNAEEIVTEKRICGRIAFVQTSPISLLPAEKGRLRNAVANLVPASHCVPKILGTSCGRLTHSLHCLT